MKLFLAAFIAAAVRTFCLLATFSAIPSAFFLLERNDENKFYFSLCGS
jgi:hypothetical protein